LLLTRNSLHLWWFFWVGFFVKLVTDFKDFLGILEDFINVKK